MSLVKLASATTLGNESMRLKLLAKTASLAVYNQNKYMPPYTVEELQRRYPYLLKDPVHLWRAVNGKELIHPEPDKEEQIRIWDNWNLMTPQMKRISDEKSLELFGMTNPEHHKQIMTSIDLS